MWKGRGRSRHTHARTSRGRHICEEEEAPPHRAPETTTPREKNATRQEGSNTRSCRGEEVFVCRGVRILSVLLDAALTARGLGNRRLPPRSTRSCKRRTAGRAAGSPRSNSRRRTSKEERRSERAPRRRRRRAQTPPAVCYSSRTLSTSPRRRHCRIDHHHHRHQLAPSRDVDVAAAVAPPHRPPSPPQADRGPRPRRRGGQRHGGGARPRASGGGPHRASRATHQIGGRRSLTPRRSHRARSLTNDPPIAMAARPSPITASPPRTRRRPTPRS